MYVSLSSPGAEFFVVDKTVSSSSGVKGVSVSACSLFAVCLRVRFVGQL